MHSGPVGYSDPPDSLMYERQAVDDGYARIAGVDEVGRGPLAGPVVACAVVFEDLEHLPDGIGDSKRLSARQREGLFEQLSHWPGICFGYGVVSSEEIDRLNILRATHAAMRRALAQLDPPCDFVLVDGLPVPGLQAPSLNLIKGDSRSQTIGAASILAKVTRDRIMGQLETTYPGYGFARHKGYPTAEHLAALGRLGPAPVHRRSFKPVADVLDDGSPRQPTLDLGVGT